MDEQGRNGFSVNIGGWNNHTSAIQPIRRGRTNDVLGRQVPQTVESNKWYDVKISVTPQLVTLFMDGKEILSAKLTGYKPEKEAFTNLTKSFFYEIADFKWGYSNVSQTRPGGSIRKYSLSQRLNDSISYSMAYLAACAYMGIKPESKDASERLIVYDDTDFLAIESDKVLENASLLKDKIVILGTLEEEADMHITPVGKLSGMKILAYSTMTFMNHKKIQHMGKFASLLMAFVVCMFCAWAGRHIRRKYTNVTSYILKLFYFVVTAFLVWIAFILFVHFDYDANLLYSLLGLALVEEGRLQYSSIVKTLGKHTKWNFIKKSIYYDK
jgi:hypothetical protein